MPGGCSSRHSGERIEVAFRHKVVRSEEFLQSFVNLFRGQWLLQYIPLFQRQDFNVAYLRSAMSGRKVMLFSFTLVLFRLVSTFTGSVQVSVGRK